MPRTRPARDTQVTDRDRRLKFSTEMSDVAGASVRCVAVGARQQLGVLRRTSVKARMSTLAASRWSNASGSYATAELVKVTGADVTQLADTAMPSITSSQRDPRAYLGSVTAQCG